MKTQKLINTEDIIKGAKTRTVIVQGEQRK
jgi:hypothetical protein